MATIPNPLDALRRVTPRTGVNPVPNAMGLQQQSNTAALQRPPATPAVANRPGPAPLAAPPQTGGGPVPPKPPAPPPIPPPGPKAPTPPAPAPAPTPAPAPAPAPQAPPAQPPAPPEMYGPGGGTQAQSGSLEDQLRNYFTQTMGGVTSDAFINRAKNQLGSATEGMRAQNVNRINDDAIARGLFRSGIPSDQAAAAGRSAQGSFASGLANILQSAEQQNIAARQGAAQGIQGLLESNRSWDQYQQQRADANRGGGGGPSTFTYIDPDTGESYDIPMDAMGGLF